MTTVAIDFGTSNTVVCIQDSVTQTRRILKFERISRCFETAEGQVNVVPSLVFIQGHEQVLLGEQVRLQRLGFTQSQRLFQTFKRDLVADYQPPARQIDGYSYTAEYVSEVFLKQIWQQLIQQLQPSRTIFTVPVGAFERYLSWFRDLADKLDLPDVHLVDESTAAALGYAVERPGSLVLVVDFGGSTLDLSLVRTVATSGGQKVLQAQVLAQSDAYVGGVDIDTWIVEHYLQQIGSSQAEVKQTSWQNLLEIAENLKIQLSIAVEAKAIWFDENTSYELQLSREELEEILKARKVLEQIRQAMEEVLAIAHSKGISKTEIEQVLLVGGSCQIPVVQQLIISYFGQQRVKLDKPFAAVVHGALAFGQLVVDDYLQYGYAIRLWEPHAKTYSYFSLFDKGTQYPCQCLEPLTLQVATEGQREIRLDIGEVAEVSQAEVTFDAQGRMTSSQLNKQAEFRSLAQHQQVCVAHLDPPGQKGVDRIEVAFEVNEQRVLLATVKDLVTSRVLLDRSAIAKLR